MIFLDQNSSAAENRQEVKSGAKTHTIKNDDNNYRIDNDNSEYYGASDGLRSE